MTRTRDLATKAANRALTRALLTRLGPSLLLGAAGGLGLVLADRLIGPGLAWWMTVTPPIALGGVIGVWLALRSRATPLSATSEVDSAFRLEDRLASALSLEQSKNDDPFAALAVEEGEQYAGRVDVRQAIPLKTDWTWLAWPLVGAGALALGIWLPPQHLLRDEAALEQQIAQAQYKQDVEQKIEQAAKRVQETAADEETKDLFTQDELDLISQLNEQLASGEKDPEDAAGQAAKTIEDAARRARQEAEKLRQQQQSLDDILRDAASRQEDTGGSQDQMSPGEQAAERVREALRRQDPRAAAEAIERLQQEAERMNASDREEAAEQLRDLADDIQNAGSDQQQRANAQREQQQRDLEQMGLSPEEAEQLSQETDPQAIEDALRERGVDEQSARDAAERIAEQNGEREAQEQAAQAAQELSEAVDEAASDVEQEPQQQQEQPGEQTGEQGEQGESQNTQQSEPGDQQQQQQQGEGQERSNTPNGMGDPRESAPEGTREPDGSERQREPDPNASPNQNQSPNQQQDAPQNPGERQGGDPNQQQGQEGSQPNPETDQNTKQGGEQQQPGEQPQGQQEPGASPPEQQGNTPQGEQPSGQQSGEVPDQSDPNQPEGGEQSQQPSESGQPGEQQGEGGQQGTPQEGEARGEEGQSNQREGQPEGQSGGQQPTSPEGSQGQSPDGTGSGNEAGRGLKNLQDRLNQMGEQQERGQQLAENSEELQKQARELYDSLSPEEQDELANWAKEQMRQGNTPEQMAEDIFRPKTFQDEMDIRRAGGDDQVAAEYFNPDSQSEWDGSISRRATKETLRDAAAAGQRAVEEQVVPARYRNVGEYFRRVAEKADQLPDAPPAAPAAPAQDAPDAG